MKLIDNGNGDEDGPVSNFRESAEMELIGM